MEGFDTEYETSHIEDFANELECLKYNKVDLLSINCFFIYVNKDRLLHNLEKKQIDLSIPNTLLKNELYSLVKNNNYIENKKYRLNYLLKYNFNINEKDLKNMENFCFLDTIDILNDISFHPTVEVMKDINSLFFVFIESSTRRVTKKNINSYKKTAKKLDGNIN